MDKVDTIMPEELKARLAKGEKPHMIDVREDEEVAAGMIPGAIHIPLGEIPVRYDELNANEEIIFICRSGNRSGKACEFLQAQGFTGVKNMVGGMLAWDQLA